MKTLQEVQCYKNKDVVTKFRKQFALDENEAEDIFNETIKFLWFAGNTELTALAVDRAISIIDEMWHTFLTFTTEYTRFCNENFGRYIHHMPVTELHTRIESEEFARDPEKYKKQRLERLKRQYEEIARLLGNETLLKWQCDYRVRYSPTICRRLAEEALRSEQSQSAVRQVSEEIWNSVLLNATGNESLAARITQLQADNDAKTRCERPACFQCICNRPRCHV